MMKIVAPAGNMERFHAAVKGGAHEIYMGLKGFGARRNAENFSLTEYIEALNYAHERGVRIFLTLNTVMRDMEIEALYENVKKLYENGLDAIIVQDLGLFSFLRSNFPGIDLHGSTQMTVANHVEANYLKEIGFSRVVLARELSFEEIEKVRKKTDIELEIFVSGALCISYSGNCYLSSFIGGRSGNRGLCAQPCRKIYKDGKEQVAYNLSPKDQMMGQNEVEALARIGIESIKIEGRMKSPEYVYETVNYYKTLIGGEFAEAKSKELFNRGYSKGYFYGVDKKIMNDKYSSDFGRYLGEIKNGYLVLAEDVVLGDGLSYISKDYYKLGGEYLSKIVVDGLREKRRSARAGEKIKLSKEKVPKGSKYVYRSYSKEAMDSADNSIKLAKRQMDIEGRFEATVGTQGKITVWAINNRGERVEVVAFTEKPLEEASKRVLSVEEIQNKLGETGDTTFRFKDIEVETDGKTFLPVSILKNLRREALASLTEKLLASYLRKVSGTVKKMELDFLDKGKLEISAVAANEKQREVIRSMGIDKVYLRQMHVARETRLGEIDTTEQLATTLYHALARGKKEEGTVLNWNLNITNTYALREVSKIEGVDTVVLSPEINYDTMRNMGEVQGLRKAAVIYGKLLGMYIEVPLAGKGRTETIQNEQGDTFVIRGNDMGNTEVTLDKPMNLIPRMDDLEDAGLDEVILEFTDESPEEIRSVIESLKDRSGVYNPYNYERGAY